MLVQTSKICTLLLAGFAAAGPIKVAKRDQVLLGYRTVNSIEARKINDAQTLIRDAAFSDAKAQLGEGVYTSPAPGEWDPMPGNWYCVVKVDSDALDRVSKAWVPEWGNHEGIYNWFQPDHIDAYVESIHGSWVSDHTIKMSIIYGKPDKVQLLVPPPLLNAQGGGMGIWAQCFSSIDQLPTQDRVNYDDWQNNIGGDRVLPDSD